MVLGRGWCFGDPKVGNRLAKKMDPLGKLREICLTLPDARETLTRGEAQFRVGDKIFAGYAVPDGTPGISFKLELWHADIVVQDPRFRRSKYFGSSGWVWMNLTDKIDWNQVRELVLESYALIAPKRSVQKLREQLNAEAPIATKTKGRKRGRNA